jgi:hypothetical protein
MVRSGGFTNVRIRNNNLQTTGGVNLIRLNTVTGIRFEGNNYWSSGSTFKIYWAGTTYSSLSTWRTATGQEKISGASSGYNLNPELTDPGKGVTIGDPRLLPTLSGYKLKSTSMIIGKGLNLKSSYGWDIGNQDFFGGDITQLTSFSIGAHQPGTSSTIAYSRSDGTNTNSFGEVEQFGIKKTSLSAFPNPVRQKSTIKIYSEKEEPFALEVYDLRGTLVNRLGEGTTETGRIYEYDLEGSKLADGFYIVRLVAGSQVQSMRILVQK